MRAGEDVEQRVLADSRDVSEARRVRQGSKTMAPTLDLRSMLKLESVGGRKCVAKGSKALCVSDSINHVTFSFYWPV